MLAPSPASLPAAVGDAAPHGHARLCVGRWHASPPWPQPVVPTGGEGFGSRQGWPRRVHLSLGARLADHMVGDKVAVEDVPRGGDEAAAVADACRERGTGLSGQDAPGRDPWGGGPRPQAMLEGTGVSPWGLTVQGVCVHLQVTLAVGFRGEGGQADQADERPLSCRTDGQADASAPRQGGRGPRGHPTGPCQHQMREAGCSHHLNRDHGDTLPGHASTRGRKQDAPIISTGTTGTPRQAMPAPDGGSRMLPSSQQG